MLHTTSRCRRLRGCRARPVGGAPPHMAVVRRPTVRSPTAPDAGQGAQSPAEGPRCTPRSPAPGGDMVGTWWDVVTGPAEQAAWGLAATNEGLLPASVPGLTSAPAEAKAASRAGPRDSPGLQQDQGVEHLDQRGLVQVVCCPSPWGDHETNGWTRDAAGQVAGGMQGVVGLQAVGFASHLHGYADVLGGGDARPGRPPGRTGQASSLGKHTGHTDGLVGLSPLGHSGSQVPGRPNAPAAADPQEERPGRHGATGGVQPRVVKTRTAEAGRRHQG